MQVPQAASAPLHQTPVSEETVGFGWVMLTQSPTSCVGLRTQRKEGTEFIPLLNSDATVSPSLSALQEINKNRTNFKYFNFFLQKIISQNLI